MVEKNKTSKIIEIENKINHCLEEENFHLIEVEYSEKKDSLVSISIYNQTDTTVAKLGKINKKIFIILNELPFLKDNFSLEVSSPGIYRKIQFFKEFNIFEGKKIIIKLENGDNIEGILKGLDKENSFVIVLDKNGKEIQLSLNEIKNASLNG